MKQLIILAILSLGLSISALAQGGVRMMDNFDRSGGVQVHRPPSPVLPIETSSGKKNTRGKKLVRKTASTAAVSDGLAFRESGYSRPSLRMGGGTHLKGFTTGNPAHDAYIVESSRRYSIDPLLIYAQMHQESSFKLNARSHKGASGLMQLMPATARRFGVTKIYDPKQNIEAGVKYMRWLLNTFNGDVVLALAGYNAGEGAVMKYGNNVPPYRETREYVRRISARYNSISDSRYIQTTTNVPSNNVAKVTEKEAKPLTVVQDAVVIKQADGSLKLINQ